MWAQTARSSITGLVKDSSGAVVVGATVTVTNQGTAGTSTAKSQADGDYLVPDLVPGVYQVSGEASGFERLVVTGLNLDVSSTLTQDLTLQIGKTSQTVSVTGTTSLVETTTNMEGTTIDAVHLLELPLADRATLLVINLANGVYYARATDMPGAARADSGNGPGSNPFSMNATLDGTDVAGAGSGLFSTSATGGTVQPPPDSVQELRLETNNLSAEYGRGGTVIVNEVTKSGSNQFHGDGYDFIRNSYFDAAGWGNTTNPLLQQNTAGGTIGGPIKKDKTFFFFSYEDLLDNAANTAIDSVGLPAFRTGDFTQATRDANGTAVLVPIYDPATGGTTQIACNGVLNKMCTNRLNPVAAAMVPFLAQPNQTPLDPLNNSGNFQVYPPWTTRRPFYMGRVDEQLNSNNKLYFRFVVQPLSWLIWAGSDAAPQFGALANPQATYQRDQIYTLNFSHLFSPTFFVNFAPGVDRSRILFYSTANQNVNYPAQLGLGSVPGPGMPYMNTAGGQVPVDGFGGPTHRFQALTYSNFPVNFTKIMGKHTLKFGGQVERYNSNAWSLNGGGGQFNFTGTYTQGIADGAPIANTGINFADFMLGYFGSDSVGPLTASYGMRTQLYAGYVQDDWRATPNLTLNLGLRYETTAPVYSSNNEFQSFNPFVPNPGAGTGNIPAGAMGETTFQNLNGVGKYLYDWYKTPFAPRFGFAYRLFGKSDTVLRGGFGIYFYNSMPYGATAGLGFARSYSASYLPNTNPSPVLGPSTVPAAGITGPPTSALSPTFGDIGTPYATSSMNFYYPNRASPYAMEFNLGLQHQWKKILLEVGYVGNLGRHNPISNYNVNLVPPQLLSETSVPVQLRRPYTEFSGSGAQLISYADSNFTSDYHSLNLKSERRYSNGFSWVAAFTWAKWVDNGNLIGGTGAATSSPNIQNIYDRAEAQSLSTADIPLRFVFSPIVELPFGKGKHWLNQGGVVNQLVGGWETSVMGTYQNGSPIGLTVNNGGTILGDVNQTLWPNVVSGCNPNSPNQWQPAAAGRGIQYINPACFTVPAAYTYGNASRLLPNLFGPGVAQMNLMVAKNFYFKERYRIQFRAEAVDVFNTPQFGGPATTVSGGNFGIIGGTDGFTRRIMDFGLKFYF
jgi:hypothetical protein